MFAQKCLCPKSLNIPSHDPLIYHHATSPIRTPLETLY